MYLYYCIYIYFIYIYITLCQIHIYYIDNK